MKQFDLEDDISKLKKKTLEGHKKAIRDITYSESYKILVSVGFDFQVFVWNPYWEKELRDFSGLDKPVINFLERATLVHQMADQLKSFISFWIKHFDVVDRSYLTVALGCTGGQHRSVYMVERLARELRETADPVQIRHRDLHQVRRS